MVRRSSPALRIWRRVACVALSLRRCVFCGLTAAPRLRCVAPAALHRLRRITPAINITHQNIGISGA